MQKTTSAWRLCCAIGVLSLGCASSPGVDAETPAPCPNTASTPTEAVTAAASPASFQYVDARALALHSSGEARGKAWLLSDNGFVGSYLFLETPHSVTFRVRASGHAEAGAPRIELAVAGLTQALELAPELGEYSFTFELSRGLYFVRLAYVNDLPNNSREVTVHGLAADHGTWSNDNSDANALAAADTTIAHYRRGSARITLAGVNPGDKVRVSLERHAFNFGTNIPYGENKLIPVETVRGQPEYSVTLGPG